MRRFSLVSLKWVDKLDVDGNETFDDPAELKKLYFNHTEFHGGYWGTAMTEKDAALNDPDPIDLAHVGALPNGRDDSETESEDDTDSAKPPRTQRYDDSDYSEQSHYCASDISLAI